MITKDEPDLNFAQVSTDGIDLLKKLLTKNPLKRPTAKQCLEHPWITSQNSESSDGAIKNLDLQSI